MDYRHPNNFHKPFLTTAEVCRLARGVELETLRRWRKLGYIHLSMENPGRGRQRLYSLSDAIQIAVVDLLSGVFFQPSHFSMVLAGTAESIAMQKIMDDWAASEGVIIEQPSQEEIEEYKRKMGWDLPDVDIDPNYEIKPDSRYILLFEKPGGDIDFWVTASPHLDRGVWITVDVHGIVDEIVRLIPVLQKQEG